ECRGRLPGADPAGVVPRRVRRAGTTRPLPGLDRVRRRADRVTTAARPPTVTPRAGHARGMTPSAVTAQGTEALAARRASAPRDALGRGGSGSPRRGIVQPAI